jgi:hypothetical protein
MQRFTSMTNPVLVLLELGSAAAAFFLCGSSFVTHAQSASELSAFVGTWKINPAKTKMGRNGPTGQNILRSTTFTFKFVPDGQNVRMDVYAEYPQPSPTRMARVITGRILPCESTDSCLTAGGDPKEQTYAWYEIDSHMLARMFWVKGKPYDYSSMCVSTDGKTLTLISWAPETPEYQNVQVFDKKP